MLVVCVCVCVFVCVRCRVVRNAWSRSLLSLQPESFWKREVKCTQVRWSNKSAGFVSSVWNMNIKHIRIMGGSKRVMLVIPSDLQVTLCLRSRGDKYLHEHVRRLGDALHPLWLTDCYSKTRQQCPVPTHLLDGDADPSGPISNKYVSLCWCVIGVILSDKWHYIERARIHSFTQIKSKMLKIRLGRDMNKLMNMIIY